ncbi:ATP-binding protein [Lentzea aerocolonigenes]|uniref:ATP-binding protein n=1 Tax=Lentzea aerocolonigenes TaxID=68170 RepID=UPI00068E1A63|nr:tetratricopeptide repeat protein [Lentzea aerocolonigenes]MCP2245398.1 putative ATPase [Lentzea aerocolonigenes]
MADQFAALVRHHRRRAGLTQEALAAQSGVSVSTIRGVETGRRTNPQLASVRRLAQALRLQESEQEELLAAAGGRPSADRPVPRQLPSPPAGFTGRARELALLDTAALVVVSALGGTGKTALALHWAHGQAERFPDGQLHVDLRGFGPGADPMRPADVQRAFLAALGVDGDSVPADDQERTALYRSVTADRRLLLVLDNAAGSDQLVPLLPGGGSCTVVVTSRVALTGLVATHGAVPVPLGVLSGAEARALLATRLGETRLAAEPDAVTTIVERCAGLPLALAIIAGRARVRPDVPLRWIADELRDRAARLDALDTDEGGISLRSVLSWSYQALSPEASLLAGLLALAPGADLSAAAVESLSAVPPRKPLAELEAASLVGRSADGRYRMHDLVRLYAREQALALVPERTRSDALRRLVDFYLHTALPLATSLAPHIPPIELATPAAGCRPLTGADPLTWFGAEHAGLLDAQQAAERHGWHTRVWQLAWVLNTYHYRTDRMDSQRETWQRGLTAARLLGDPVLLGRAHRLLGDACARLHLPEAFDHLHAALAIVERGDDLDERAHTHRSITVAWAELGDHERALEHATTALELFRASGFTAREAEALNAVGWHTAKLGRFTEALPLCRRALEMCRGLHHQSAAEASTLEDLAFIYQHTGRLVEAAEHYRASAAVWGGLGDRHHEAESLRMLGEVHRALGEADQARTVWRRAAGLLRTTRHAAKLAELEDLITGVVRRRR